MRADARLISFSAILAALSITACSGNRSIVGEWESPGVATRTITFREDGSFEVGAKGANMVAIIGNYKLDKTRLTFTDLSLKTMAGIPFVDATLLLGTDLPTKLDTTISWKNKDELLIEGNILVSGSYARKLKDE